MNTNKSRALAALQAIRSTEAVHAMRVEAERCELLREAEERNFYQAMADALDAREGTAWYERMYGSERYLNERC